MILGDLPIKIMMKALLMKKLQIPGLLSLLLWLIVGDVHALSERDDIRERCRAAVSGQLLTVYNDVDGTRDRIQALEKKNSKLQLRRGELLQEWKQKKKEIEGLAYDRTLEEAVMILEHQLQRVQTEWEQGELLLGRYRRQNEVAKRRLKEISPLIAKVFERVYPADLKSSKGYRFTLAYKERCSRFQYLCPLSDTGRADLRRISEVLGKLEECDRYAQLQLRSR